jgi:uncharacterized protein YegJ (DUF2314 family)
MTSDHRPLDGQDPEMAQARRAARDSFKFFWRELSWERRRIVPGLGMAAVKVAFPTPRAGPSIPPLEFMWIDDIAFDGHTVSGKLLNDSHWTETLRAGVPVSVPLAEINDWLYAIGDRPYGGFTVDVLRARMPAEERRAHDAAWGLDFGAPGAVATVPPYEPAARRAPFWTSLLARKRDAAADAPEHPMSENAADKIEQALRQNPSWATDVDAEGWTMLQREALAGNATPVSLLLRYGAERGARTPRGSTALELARVMDWPRVVRLLLD